MGGIELIPYQILAPDEVVNRDALLASGLTGKLFMRVYKLGILSRAFSDRLMMEATTDAVTKLKHERLAALYIPLRGSENVLALVLALEPEDLISYYARWHHVAFARSIRLVRPMADGFFGTPNPEAVPEFMARQVGLPHALVGANLPHAAGLAYAAKIKGERRIVVGMVGDGATSTCDFHSALNFAAVLKVPIVFICVDNGWAISTPKEFQTAADYARKAESYGMPSFTIDGSDPFAVYNAMRHAAAYARETQSPIFGLMKDVTRDGPHTSGVSAIYEPTPEELERIARLDPVKRNHNFAVSPDGNRLLGIRWDEEKDRLMRRRVESYVNRQVDRSYRELARALAENRGPKIVAQGVTLASHPRALPPKYSIQTSIIGPRLIEKATGRDALSFAMLDSAKDQEVVIEAPGTHDHHRIIFTVHLGQDIGKIGGVHRVLALAKEFVLQYLPEHKSSIARQRLPLFAKYGRTFFLDTPLDESGIVGFAVGLALAGLKVSVEIQFSGFVTIAYHQIVSELARIIHRHAGIPNLRIIIRLPDGAAKHIEHHRESFARKFDEPGLVVAYPGRNAQSIYDAYRAGLERTYLPVILLEHKTFYSQEMGPIERRPPTKSLLDFDAVIAREGTDLTVVAFGKMLHTALEAAEIVANPTEPGEKSISVEVFDPVVISPWNRKRRKMLVESAMKTGGILTAHEEPVQAGSGDMFIGSVMRSRAFHYLKRKPRSVGGKWAQMPPPPFWESYIPQTNDLVHEIRLAMQDPLDDDPDLALYGETWEEEYD